MAAKSPYSDPLPGDRFARRLITEINRNIGTFPTDHGEAVDLNDQRLIQEVNQMFKNHQSTAALFLDAEAAFDRCWHNGIKFKLKKNLNLPSRIIRLLSSFLSDRSLTVLYEGCYSQRVNLKAGTPQGSPLSPLIYIIYVNDYPEEIQEHSSLSQFADDTALWTSAFTRAYSIRKLQKSLNILESWCRRWRVKLNGDKSSLIITRTRDPDDGNYALQLFDIRPTKNLSRITH